MGQNAGAPSPAPQTDADCGDAALLRRYVRHESQAAFAELVRRYGGLVHAACVREVDDPQLAEDATQVVFLLLARKAPSLRHMDSLAGWLFRASRFSARNALRRERRRKVHEQAVIEDMTQAHLNGPPIPSWSLLEPLLNAALASLRPHEQEVILLRYLEGARWRETAARLGLAEDAAQKRGTRAVDKMRRFVNQQGLVLSVAGLTALLSEEAAQAASLPPAMTLKIAGSPSPNVTALYQGMVHTMKLTKIAAVLSGLAMAGVVSGLLWARTGPAPLRFALVRAAASAPHGAETPQEMLTQVHAHYKGLASFSTLVTRRGSFAADPGGIVQQLRWRRGGRFDLHRTIPDSARWPDIYSDGSQVVSVFPNGKRKTQALSLSPDMAPEWPVAGGTILQWLQSTPLSEEAFSPHLDKTIVWQFGSRTSWHGQKAKEIRVTGPSPKRTGQISFFVDESTQELIGVELLSPPNLARWDYLYTNQKANPPLPATPGSAP